MAQTFSPYRIVLALVLSIILALNVAQLTQAKTTYRMQLESYPSQAEAKDAITFYYNNLGDFHGKNGMQLIDSVTYGAQYGTGTFDRFGACVQYQFISLPSKSGQTAQTARHIFTFQYGIPGTPVGKESWVVIGMDLSAC